MKTTRPRTLREAIAISPAAPPAADAFGVEPAHAPEDAVNARRGILVRVSPETRRALKLTAFHRNTTVQAIMLEAIEIVLGRHEEASAPRMRSGL